MHTSWHLSCSGKHPGTGDIDRSSNRLHRRKFTVSVWLIIRALHISRKKQPYYVERCATSTPLTGSTQSSHSAVSTLLRTRIQCQQLHPADWIHRHRTALWSCATALSQITAIGALWLTVTRSSSCEEKPKSAGEEERKWNQSRLENNRIAYQLELERENVLH